MPADVAAMFRAAARTQEGGASAALRRLVIEKVAGGGPTLPIGVGRGQQVGVRLKPAERLALTKAAQEQATSPANWLRALALAHLLKRPQWNPAELQALREVFIELRRIGNNMNQVSRALNAAVHVGQVNGSQAAEAREAAEAIRTEMRRVVAVMTGNFEYWGIPQEAEPKVMFSLVDELNGEAAALETKRKLRPRRRPSRFLSD